MPICPRLELLLAEAEGVLPEDVASCVREHLAACDRCRGRRGGALERDPDPLTDAENQRIRARLNSEIG